MQICNYKILSPYEVVLQQIEEKNIDPYDIDVFFLAELFKEIAKELTNSEYLREAGRFLEASAKLIKLQIEDIFPKPKPERRKITIREVREVLESAEGFDEASYDLSWLWEHEIRVGRPSGAKNKRERRLTWEEFWKVTTEDVKEVLHKETDYKALAKKVREKLLRGEGIEGLTEFIAYLHAYMEFEDVPAVRL